MNKLIFIFSNWYYNNMSTTYDISYIGFICLLIIILLTIIMLLWCSYNRICDSGDDDLDICIIDDILNDINYNQRNQTNNNNNNNTVVTEL